MHLLQVIHGGGYQDSIAMAQKAVSEGITHILATPHYKNDHWDNEKKIF